MLMETEEDESAAVSRWPARNVAIGSENATARGPSAELAPGGRAKSVTGMMTGIQRGGAISKPQYSIYYP